MTGHRCHFDLKSNNTFPIETLEFLPFFKFRSMGASHSKLQLRPRKKKLASWIIRPSQSNDGTKPISLDRPDVDKWTTFEYGWRNPVGFYRQTRRHANHFDSSTNNKKKLHKKLFTYAFWAYNHYRHFVITWCVQGLKKIKTKTGAIAAVVRG
jgi:hypothetical protein